MHHFFIQHPIITIFLGLALIECIILALKYRQKKKEHLENCVVEDEIVAMGGDSEVVDDLEDDSEDEMDEHLKETSDGIQIIAPVVVIEGKNEVGE